MLFSPYASSSLSDEVISTECLLGTLAILEFCSLSSSPCIVCLLGTLSLFNILDFRMGFGCGAAAPVAVGWLVDDDDDGNGGDD